MNKPVLQNVVRNKTGKFGVSATVVDNFEKTAFKDMYCKIPYIFEDTTDEQGKKALTNRYQHETSPVNT